MISINEFLWNAIHVYFLTSRSIYAVPYRAVSAKQSAQTDLFVYFLVLDWSLTPDFKQNYYVIKYIFIVAV
jgi:hypothetical protein